MSTPYWLNVPTRNHAVYARQLSDRDNLMLPKMARS